jgi:hypothetical protein
MNVFEDVKEYVESGKADEKAIHFDMPWSKGAETRLPDPEETKLIPKTRGQRDGVAGAMAAQLMDFFIANLGNINELNPIRDGIPQCKNHPFVPPKSVGCIHMCAKRDPNLSLPVVRDYTLGDVFNWVKEIVTLAVATADKKKGWYAPDLAR